MRNYRITLTDAKKDQISAALKEHAKQYTDLAKEIDSAELTKAGRPASDEIAAAKVSKRGSGHAASWTPERKAKHAARMKKVWKAKRAEKKDSV